MHLFLRIKLKPNHMKNKIVLSLLILGSYQIGEGQTCPPININGGFESLNSTPYCDASPVPAEFSVSKATGWYGINTPDVFTANFQNCLSAAYVRTYTYAAGFDTQTSNREYIYRSVGTLRGGACYKITAYFRATSLYLPSSSVGFWIIPGNSVNMTHLGPSAQLYNGIVWTPSAPTGWYKHEVTFTAASTGNYMLALGSAMAHNGAYVCVDDISLVRCTPSAVGYVSQSPVCQPACVNFGVTMWGGISPYTYSWSNGSASANQTICTPGQHNYNVTVTDNTGCSAPAQIGFTINPAPGAAAGPDKVLCGTATSTTIGYAVPPPIKGQPQMNYSWSPTTGLGCPTCSITSALPGTSTLYTLTVTNPITGCTSSDQVWVYISTPPCNDRQYIGSSEGQMEMNDVVVYPNPSNGEMQLNYELPAGASGEFILFDMAGKQLASYTMTEGATALSISEPSLSNGLYVYKILVNGTEFSTGKISIQK